MSLENSCLDVSARMYFALRELRDFKVKLIGGTEFEITHVHGDEFFSGHLDGEDSTPAKVCREIQARYFSHKESCQICKAHEEAEILALFRKPD
jgi:hypothetical protein